MQKIGIFGGSFNPPHAGHLRLAKEFFRQLELDKLLIIPSNLPPHKSGAAYASAQDRLAMCRLCFDFPGCEVSDLEIQQGGVSYTVLTLRQLKKSYPDAHLFLLVGEDMLSTFDRWYCYEEILDLATLCAAKRTKESDLETLCPPALPREQVILWEDTDPVVVSSTALRSQLAAGAPTGDTLPAQVAQYIAERGLYRDGR